MPIMLHPQEKGSLGIGATVLLATGWLSSTRFSSLLEENYCWLFECLMNSRSIRIEHIQTRASLAWFGSALLEFFE
jgi:hypothetical protein